MVFEVSAMHATDGTDPTPATRIFTVDTTPPDTSISSGPSGLSNNPTPEFNFASPDSGASFECRHHVAGQPVPPFASCASPYRPGPLGDGSYVFEVAAIDAVSHHDDSPAGWTYQIDTTPPETEITGGPGDTTAATAVFLFSAPGATGSPAASTAAPGSPAGRPGLFGAEPRRAPLRGHRRRRRRQQDPTPARHAWQVLKPGLVIPAAVSRPSLSPRSSFRSAGRSPSLPPRPRPPAHRSVQDLRRPHRRHRPGPRPARVRQGGGVAGSALSRASARSRRRPPPGPRDRHQEGAPARQAAPDAAARAAPDLHRSRRPLPLGDLRAHPQALTRATPRETPGLALPRNLNTLVTKERRSSLRGSPLEDWSKQAWLSHAPPVMSVRKSRSASPLSRWGS